MWFNRGSGGSPVRLNRLPHGLTPASLRCLCATNQVWMPCSGYGPLRGAVMPGTRPGLARIPWAGAVVTAQDTVHASSSADKCKG